MKKLIVTIVLLIVAMLVGCTDNNLSEYYITFDSNGGTIVDQVLVYEGNLIVEPISPVKENYEFAGWYLDTDLSMEYNFDDPITKSELLYAKWVSEDPNQSIVSFNTNGGSLISDLLIDYGTSVNEPSNPTKDFFVLVGWYVDSAFTIVYNFESPVIENIILYAKWEFDIGDSVDLTTLPYYEYLSESNPVITITIEDVGIIELELFPDVAPNTVNNFIMYIQDGDFTDNTFHRVIENFMIQGGNTYSTTCPITGDFSSNGVINNLEHFRGVISMARTQDFDSATSQFFIVHENSYFLDENYATFGGLISGFDVLDAIAEVGTNFADAPLELVVIESITVDLNGYVALDPVCAD